jgi:hypothetical protein
MRFFSNENRDPNDEPSNVDLQTRAAEENPDQAHDEHPERVQSEPVTVPQQRSGSPWSDAPGSTDDNADAELADQERADGTEDAPGPVDDHREPIALGGPEDDTDRDIDTVSAEAHDHDHDGHDGHDDGAHEAHEAHEDAVDLPLDDTDKSSSEEQDESTPAATTITTYGPDGVVTTSENGSTAATDTDDSATATDPDDQDADLKDEGDFDDPTAVDPATDEPLDTDASDVSDTDVSDTSHTDVSDTDASDVDASDHDTESDHEEAVLVTEPAAVNNVDDADVPVVPIPVPVGSAADESSTDTTPAPAPAEDKLPGSVTAPDLGKIFAAADAQSFQDRWREVQLKFVDTPKEATTEAASLLDEVVDKLATSLRAQKDSLSTDTSDDTEQLRVELRGYRDILNRVLGL